MDQTSSHKPATLTPQAAQERKTRTKDSTTRKSTNHHFQHAIKFPSSTSYDFSPQ